MDILVAEHHRRQPLPWTLEMIDKLINLGRSGAPWNEISGGLQMSAETVRRKWTQKANQDDKNQRAICIDANRKLADMLALQGRKKGTDPGMGNGVRFNDDPSATRPEPGRIPARATWVHYETGSSWAARDWEHRYL